MSVTLAYSIVLVGIVGWLASSDRRATVDSTLSTLVYRARALQSARCRLDWHQHTHTHTDTDTVEAYAHTHIHHHRTWRRAQLYNDACLPGLACISRMRTMRSLSRYPLSSSHPFNGPLSGTTRVSRYQKGKTNLDFTGARDSEWQWHQLGRMQICTSLQTDNHASTPPLSFLQAGCPSCRPTNSVKALKAFHFT